MTRRLLPIALIAALSPWFGPQTLSAQRGGGHLGFAGSSHAGGLGRNGEFAGRRGYGLYSDLLYGGLDYNGLLDAGYPVASQPPVIILQSPAASQPAAAPVSSSVQPLMIELQGDRYVRVSGDNDSQSQTIDSDVSLVSSPSGSRVITSSEPPPALLVFRDGHQEQVRNYTIADGNLYASADTDAGLPTTHKIQLSSLDLPATVKSNHDRGIQFQLPSASNVVVVGP